MSQYYPPVTEEFNSLTQCPEDELSWFHPLPWTYRTKSGTTLWDELCYHYYAGVEGVKEIQNIWNSLEGKTDQEEFSREQALLKIQYEDAVSWRDGCVLYFQMFSHLPFPAGLKTPEHDLQYHMIHNPR